METGNKHQREKMEIKCAWIKRTCPTDLRNRKITSRDFYDLAPGEPAQKQSSPSPRKKRKLKPKTLLENIQFSDDSISPDELECSASPIPIRSYSKPTSKKNDKFQPVVVLEKLSKNKNTEVNLNENIPVENENIPAENENIPAEKDKVWF